MTQAAMESSPAADPLEAIKERIRPMLNTIRDALEQLGQELVKVESGHGGIGLESFMAWVRDSARLPVATQRVWYRVARGDLPREITATQICDSVLAGMSKPVAEGLLASVHQIPSPSEGRLVQKPIAEFTRKECGLFVTDRGIKGPSHADDKAAFKTYHASDVAFDSEEKAYMVTVSGAGMTISIPVKMIERLALQEVV